MEVVSGGLDSTQTQSLIVHGFRPPLRLSFPISLLDRVYTKHVCKWPTLCS